jgi:hypothetical protein
MVKTRISYRGLVQKSEGKLGRPRRKWMDIKMYLEEIRWEARAGLISLRIEKKWRAVVYTVINFLFP